MIVVIGTPAARAGESGFGLAGPAALAAMAAVSAGARVELVGRAGEDEAGDAVMLALARAGVGHAAVLRDADAHTPIVADVVDLKPDDPADATLAAPTLPLDRADVELGLRYLTEFRVVVVAEPLPADVVTAAADAATFANATLVMVSDGDATAPDGAIVLEAPASDPDGAFGTFLGTFATALERGLDPRDALAQVAASLGWERPADEG